MTDTLTVLDHHLRSFNDGDLDGIGRSYLWRRSAAPETQPPEVDSQRDVTAASIG
jgi:hypothetical protein